MGHVSELAPAHTLLRQYSQNCPGGHQENNTPKDKKTGTKEGSKSFQRNDEDAPLGFQMLAKVKRSALM